MADGAEGGERSRAYALRRGVRRREIRMSRLDVAQLDHEPVIFRIRHFRIVERVIAVVIAVEELAQFRGTPCAAALRLIRLAARPSTLSGQKCLETGHVLQQRLGALRRERNPLGILHGSGERPRELARGGEKRIHGLHRLERARATPRTCSRRETARPPWREIESPGLDQARDAEDAAAVGCACGDRPDSARRRAQAPRAPT